MDSTVPGVGEVFETLSISEEMCFPEEAVYIRPINAGDREQLDLLSEHTHLIINCEGFPITSVEGYDAAVSISISQDKTVFSVH